MVGEAPGVAVILCKRLNVQEGGCGGWSGLEAESRLLKGLRMKGA